MEKNIYLYIIIMATVTYAIRVIPLAFIRREIKNTFIRSFLYYVPYVTLAVMTFPAILEATQTIWSALVALLIAIFLAWIGQSLFVVSVASCVTVFLVELLLIH